jgi:hypothetical protein
MADQKNPEQQKSLEMRVAELEDRLSKMHITEEEMKAYQKVSSLVGAQAGAAPALSPQFCTCTVFRCIVHPVCIIRCIIRCFECFECGGGCIPGGGTGAAGGGFGTLGM